MAKVQVDLSSEKRSCCLPQKCLSCGKTEELQEQETLLRGASPLQFTAVLPWFMFGPTIKTAPFMFFVALILSVLVAVVTSRYVGISYYRCSSCISNRRRLKRISAIIFLLGLALLFLSPQRLYLLELGAFTTFCAVAVAGFARHRHGLKLLGLNKSKVTLWVPLKQFLAA